jgi:GABA(A) receptor-associated protein
MASLFTSKQTHTSDFKIKNSEEKRRAEAEKILAKYPDRIPIIAERYTGGDNILPDSDKKKFLVPHDLTMSQFAFVIRKRLKLKPTHAMFIFVNNLLIPSSMLMSQVYKEHKATDKFLYAVYSSEDTFGVNVDE